MVICLLKIASFFFVLAELIAIVSYTLLILWMTILFIRYLLTITRIFVTSQILFLTLDLPLIGHFLDIIIIINNNYYDVFKSIAVPRVDRWGDFKDLVEFENVCDKYNFRKR